jgi:hypothetical protein
LGKIDAKENAAGSYSEQAKLTKEGDGLHVSTAPAVGVYPVPAAVKQSAQGVFDAYISLGPEAVYNFFAKVITHSRM